MADFAKSPKLRRKVGMKRLAGLLDALRKLEGLREPRPAVFTIGSQPFLHFHYHPDATIRADIKLSKREGFKPFDVSDEAGQQELLGMVEDHLASRD